MDFPGWLADPIPQRVKLAGEFASNVDTRAVDAEMSRTDIQSRSTTQQTMSREQDVLIMIIIENAVVPIGRDVLIGESSWLSG